MSYFDDNIDWGPAAGGRIQPVTDWSGAAGPRLDNATVREVQDLLNSFPGWDKPPLAVDGIFGPATRARLIEYQNFVGLPATGIIDDSILLSLRSQGYRWAPVTDWGPAAGGVADPHTDPTFRMNANVPNTFGSGASSSPNPNPNRSSGSSGTVWFYVAAAVVLIALVGGRRR